MNPSKEQIMGKALEELRMKGADFAPSTVARSLGLSAKEFTGFLRYQDGVFLKRRAHQRRPGSVCTEVEYYPSVWGFSNEKVTADHKSVRFSRGISAAVRQHLTNTGGVYAHEIVEVTGLDKQVICKWLRENGYQKTGGHHSRHWQKVPA